MAGHSVRKMRRRCWDWVKDLGCNFVRLAHYPHNENEIRLADRMGLLVWSEIPVYWDIDWTNPATLANAEGATAGHDCARSQSRGCDLVVDVE